MVLSVGRYLVSKMVEALSNQGRDVVRAVAGNAVRPWQ